METVMTYSEWERCHKKRAKIRRRRAIKKAIRTIEFELQKEFNCFHGAILGVTFATILIMCCII